MESGKIDIRSMSPLLSVFDMRTSVHFYRDVLGFELVDHSPFYAEGEFHWAMLRFGNIELMLNTAYDEGERPEHPDPARIASHAEVVFYLGCPDVDFAYRHLVTNGFAVKPPKLVRYGGSHPWQVLSVFDPDGYQLCLQWPV
jgi:catechol 2,3-dioxygenase-like lactoylglutathione lyase family enzyme